jgi:hypothetical protein
MWVSKCRSKGQEGLGINTAEIVTSRSPPFYLRLNRLLGEHGVDRFVKDRCRVFYAHTRERPSVPPGGTFACCWSP